MLFNKSLLSLIKLFFTLDFLISKYSAVDLFMGNRNNSVLLLDTRLSGIIMVNHSCFSDCPQTELNLKLTSIYLLTYCLCYYAEILKSLKIDYRQEKEILLEKLAQFPGSAFHHTKYHIVITFGNSFLFFHTLYIKMILTNMRFEILILTCFRKETQADLSSCPHSSIKYSYIHSWKFCFLLSLSVFLFPCSFFFLRFNYFLNLLLFQSYRKCARRISNPRACVQFLRLHLYDSVILSVSEYMTVTL